MRLVRQSLTVLSISACISSQAQTAVVVAELPKLIVGDRWEYETTPRRLNDCNPAKAYKTTRIVQSAGDDGVVLKEGSREIRLNPALQELQELKGERNVMDTLAFPLTVGKSWERRQWGMTSSGAALKTDLVCEAKALEKVTVPAGEFEAVQIVCKGRWNNVTFGTGDIATYTDWYAPAVKGMVKREVVTWYRGTYCADTQALLLKFKSGQ